MLKLFVFSLILVSVTSRHHDAVSLMSRSLSALEFVSKGIPKLAPLESDEKREIFHYEQTVVIRDAGKDDDKVRRCEVVEVYKKEEAKEVLAELKKLNLGHKEVLMDKMMDLLKDCDSVDDNIKQEPESEPEPGATTPDPTAGENPILNGIVPGTNWCGFGDIAESYHDLSGLRNVDRCCRSHDLCPIKVLAKDEVYNLTNKAIYTKSHCRCDEAFHSCLKKDNGWTAKLIGSLYFNVARPECIKGVPEKPEEGMSFVAQPAARKRGSFSIKNVPVTVLTDTNFQLEHPMMALITRIMLTNF